MTLTNGEKRRYRGRVLVQSIDHYDRRVVTLYSAGFKTTLKVHTLVLKAFTGPRPLGMDGCHNEDNLADNRISNLRWDTRRENALDTQRHGTNYYRNLINCPFGHPLKSPNLVACIAAQGKRSCLACSRARERYWYWSHRGVELDYQAMSDGYYRKIIAT
jgi:hypothetical protein